MKLDLDQKKDQKYYQSLGKKIQKYFYGALTEKEEDILYLFQNSNNFVSIIPK